MKYFCFVSVCLFFCTPFLSADTIYVDGSAAGVDPNGSSASPYTAIQTAIDNAIDDDEIVVAEGVYGENLDMMGKRITLRSTDIGDPNTVAATIIDGGASGSVITCILGETPATVIEGFTIQNGSGDATYGSGAGIFCQDSSPVIKKCVFTDNVATGNFGGGIFVWGGTPTVIACTFRGNGAGTYGGGVACLESDAIVTNCVFSGNDADRGGGIACYQSDTSVTNCTLSNNTSGYGGAVYCDQNIPIITNSIMWGNAAPNGSQIYAGGGAAPTVSYSVVEGGWSGNGVNNIDSDPFFIDPDEGDLHLDSFSLCINAGDPNYRGQFDIDGQKRVRYQNVDMGAYEVFPVGGDLNSDEQVDLADLILFTSEMWLIDADLADFSLFAGQWGIGTGPIDGDLNSDDRVDMDDLLILVADDNWLVGMDLYDFSLIAGNWLYGVNE